MTIRQHFEQSMNEGRQDQWHIPMDASDKITEEETKVVQEFVYLLDKSKQLFNGLRDLPQYGSKQWQTYFARTFDVYTKLWKYQQEHRDILESRYDLKRWQIGEIASKIGQLYYHYYLRTSETNYLHEAYSFYSAIRDRAYFSKVNKEQGSELMVKKLRYYARHIVVCLLLRMMVQVKELAKELSRFVDEYTSVANPTEGTEWSLVLSEVESFIEADQIVLVLDEKSRHVTISHRFQDGMLPPLDGVLMDYLSLEDVLIVGNCQQQVKFSELTLDMYRMLQAIERTPTNHTEKSTQNRPIKRDNPHKYLLYKPTFGQLCTYLSTAFKELSRDGVLLLYLSADGSNRPSHSKGEDIAYDLGGVTTSRKTEDQEEGKKKSTVLKEVHCFHPGDLYPFTRKPLFLIIDSPTSDAFKDIPNLFGQPHMCLMSPNTLPNRLQDETPVKGNLFTLFLHSPLTGFCYINDIRDVQESLWKNCQSMVNKILADFDSQISKSKTIDVAYKQFFGDEFLRLLILRFCFCLVTLKLHRGFKDDSYYPHASPEIRGHDIIESLSIHKQILDLATMLDVRPVFFEPGEVD